MTLYFEVDQDERRLSLIIRDRQGRSLCDTEIDIDLSKCDLRNANFSGENIEGLDFSDVDLRGADFSKADLYWTYLFRSNCEGVSFRKARLSGVVLDWANLKGADFSGAYISYDNVGGSSSLIEADLSEANLEGADLKGSRYNHRTIFPQGFDPTLNGMILED